MAVRRKEYTFRDGDVIDRIEFHDGNYGAPGKKRKKNNVTGDKAEDRKFLSYFVEWRQFLAGEVYYI